jgi:erythrocyte band 7 integral membrane protein
MHGGYGAPQEAPPVPPHQNQMQMQPANKMQMKPAITNQPMRAAGMEQRSTEQNFLGKVKVACCSVLSCIFCPCTIGYIINIVQEYERAVILRNGIVQGKAAGPGLFYIIPGVDEMNKVDLRERAVDIQPQEVLTKDSVSLRVDAVVYYEIFDPTIMVLGVQDARVATIQTVATNLRSCFSNYTLSDVLEKQDEIQQMILKLVDIATDPWGIRVTRVEIKDLRLPFDIQRSMAAEAESSREATAKIIAAKGERDASAALSEAAEIMSSAPAALQLRYLQTLAQIATDGPSTVLFPIPMSLKP